MKKLLTITALAIACAFTAVPYAAAQTPPSAFFTYTMVPTSPLDPGASFTIGVFLNFTEGSGFPEVAGLSYWMYQQSPTAGFPFTLTNRNQAGSLFSELQSPFLIYPQILDPINRNPDGTTDNTDLGALGNPRNQTGTGIYFIADLTFMVAADAAPGTYTISNTTAATPGVGGRISVINNRAGTTFPIAESPFSVTVIPEPSTYALLGMSGLGLAVFLYRRRVAVR